MQNKIFKRPSLGKRILSVKSRCKRRPTMPRKIKIAPSILAADFLRLGDEIRKAEAAGADMLHFDVMDAHFVPNLSLGVAMLEQIRAFTSMYLDVHLMMDNARTLLKTFADAGADGITVHLEVYPEPEPVPEPVQTTAELLAAGRPYIVPYSDFKGLEKGLLDEDRDKSGTVYYRFDRYDIDRTYRDNSRSLDDIVASVRTIQASSDSRVRMIVVAGFTSPEGRLALNNRLGSNRGASVKKYIMEQTGLPDEAIRVYNGSEDWQGLRMLVERSDMPSKERVLDIIVNMPIWDAATKHGREGELMRLDGGNPWRYMRKHFFPDLRNAAYIKVYYENK